MRQVFFVLDDCQHGFMTGPFLLSILVFVLVFSITIFLFGSVRQIKLAFGRI